MRLRGIFAVMLAAGPGLLSGCVAHAAAESTEIRVPLPSQTIDLVRVDANQVAALVDRSGHRTVAVVGLDSGSAEANFDVPDNAVGLATGPPGHLVVVSSGARGSSLDLYSTGGVRNGSVKLDGVAEKAAGTATSTAYVLVANGTHRSVEAIDLDALAVKQRIEAPAAAASLAAWLAGPEPDLLVNDPTGVLYERPAGGTTWQRLRATGVEPVYSESGNAIYALQRFDQGAYVSVIVRPYGLPTRLFPVASTAARLSDGPNRTLLILERAGASANARILTCASPLLAVHPYSGKRATYEIGTGVAPTVLAYRSVTQSEDPPPIPTGDQC